MKTKWDPESRPIGLTGKKVKNRIWNQICSSLLLYRALNRCWTRLDGRVEDRANKNFKRGRRSFTLSPIQAFARSRSANNQPLPSPVHSLFFPFLPPLESFEDFSVNSPSLRRRTLTSLYRPNFTQNLPLSSGDTSSKKNILDSSLVPGKVLSKNLH